jgi:hypothetical protein
MVYNFGGADFRGKSVKALRINFHGFISHDSNPASQWARRCVNDDRYTLSISLDFFCCLATSANRTG